jgi:mono/diheme cytochrome c family protein
VIRYRGRIDDQYGLTATSGYAKAKQTKRYLADALGEVLAGKAVRRPLVEAEGCFIGRVTRVEPRGDVTYSKQISRILQKHCQECHRPGELAPFAMLSYDDVVGWAETIRGVVHDGRMPPWFADSKPGQFSNDPRLSDEEKQQIATWVENGCPRGDDKDLPEPRTFVEGWRIGQPDQVIHMSERPFAVPAEGASYFHTFVVDPGWKTDKWIQATETLPGNRAVVHHIRVEVLIGNVTDVLYDSISWYAPGFVPGEFPQGTALFAPAGSRLAFQMHYTPNGKPELDRSLIGIRFADPKSIKKIVNFSAVHREDFKIPAGNPNFPVEATELVMKDRLLLNIAPHMHARAKAFTLEAEYPDGSREVLLDLPRYDFNWQIRYIFTEPKLIPKGTRLHATGYFDNSADNLANPDPTVDVTYGVNSSDEMMQGNYYALDRDADAACLALVAQSLGAESNQSASLVDEVARLLDFGEKSTSSAVSVARSKYQQLKRSRPDDRLLDYAMALVLANQQQYPESLEMLKRYLAGDDARPGARCAKIWLDLFAQRYSSVIDDARALADAIHARDPAAQDKDCRDAVRFLGIVFAYLDRVRPTAVDAGARADALRDVTRKLGPRYAAELQAGQQAVVKRLGELRSQDQEYDQFLAEVAALKGGSAKAPTDAPPNKDAPRPATKTSESAGPDLALTSFDTFAEFPYAREKPRIISSYAR